MAHPFASFTIVVPTFERPLQLAECLESLAGLDYPRDRYQVIVVDDQSAEPPEALVADFRRRMDVTLVVQSHGGPAVARNTGAARASSEYLAFIDDDCTPAGDWLRRLATSFAETPDHAIGGRVVNRLTENLYSTTSQTLVEYVCRYFDGRPGQFFTSNNLAVPTRVFRAVGGFHDRIPFPAAEDREFCVRWLGLGHRLAFAPEAVVLHSHVLNLRRFWRQHFTYGRGAYYYRQLLAKGGHGRFELEPLTFYSGLVLYPLSRGSGLWTLRISLLLVLSQLANALGFLYEFVRPSLALAHPRVHEKLA